MAEHATQAVIGHGTLVQRGGTAVGDAYETISEVIGFETPDEVADEHEVSHFESPGGYKEFIQGMIDAGEATITVSWRPDLYPTQANLRSDKASGELRYYRFVLPGGLETLTFRAFVKGLKRNVQPNAPVTADITFRVSQVI